MPFVAETTFYPAAGRTVDSRRLVEELTKAIQAAGSEASLRSTAWGADFPAYHLGVRFASLTDYENSRAARADVNARFVPALGALARRTGMTTLTETLQTTAVSATPPKWGTWILRSPALGKAAEARALELERGLELEAQGIRSVMAFQRGGPEPNGTFTRVLLYGSLAELEAGPSRLQAAGSAAFLTKMNALLSRPQEGTIREILIPYPAS